MSRPLDQTPFQETKTSPWSKRRGLAAVLESWRADNAVSRQLTLRATQPATSARIAPMPEVISEPVRRALASRGVSTLYTHQAQAFDLASSGRDVVIATPTASGKSLCYNLPVLHRFSMAPGARALYLFPTKALARDQEFALRALLTEAGLDHGAITFDGDTPGDARRAARERGGVLLTNPDMLHAGILPHHANWSRLFSNLDYVVVDELHTYRGVFGSHLANVLRRLQRVAAFHGSHPRFLFASATIGNPQEHAQHILGRPVELISESGAPTGTREVLVYNPPIINAELGLRASYIQSAVRLTKDLIRAEVPTIVFGSSRNQVEVMLKYLREAAVADKQDPESIMAYRGGYLPEVRRRIESELRSGAIRCVVATNALELGIDIGSLDAVVCAGYPGTLAQLWQRFGRGGRRQSGSLALLVASSAPLDQYVARESASLLSAPVEEARIDPDNAEILVQHMKCAAFELPFIAGESFGTVDAEAATAALDYLAQNNLVHRVGTADRAVYHWASDHYPATHVSLRTAGWDNVVIIDVGTGQSMGEMDWRGAHTMLHEQAIYQHDAQQYQVERFDYENHKAFVRRVDSDYYTDALTYTSLTVIDAERVVPLEQSLHAGTNVGLGDVSVVEKVVGYKKIRFHTHDNLGYGDVHLPDMQMHTTAMWLTVPEDLLASLPAPRSTAVDALRGLGVALHTVAAVGLMTDPRDLGVYLAADRAVPDAAVSLPTLYLYDRMPGGIGLAPRLSEVVPSLLSRARALIDRCDCASGCPACVGPEIAPTDEAIFSMHHISRRQLARLILDRLGAPCPA